MLVPLDLGVVLTLAVAKAPNVNSVKPDKPFLKGYAQGDKHAWIVVSSKLGQDQLLLSPSDALPITFHI